MRRLMIALVALSLSTPAIAQVQTEDTRPVRLVNINAIRTCGDAPHPSKTRNLRRTSLAATIKRNDAEGYRTVKIMGAPYYVTAC